MAETRKLAAILAADVVGFSRLTGSDEEGTQRPTVFHRVRSSGYRAADRKPRAVTFGIRITLYHNIQILAWKILKLARTTPLP